MGKVLLSADTESLLRPQFLGLDDVSLDAEDWLIPVSDAGEARTCACAEGNLEEAWVVSSDDVSGINLAAALRADNAALPVYLVMFEPSGSDASRAKQAGITGILPSAGFRERFESTRRRKGAMRKVSELEPLKLVPPIANHAEAAACPAKEPNAFVLSMLSGSGGVGKSAAVAVAAFLCARRGLRTAVLDYDLQFGDMRNLLGDVPGACIDDVLEDASRVKALASEAQKDKPCLLCAPKRLEKSEELGSHLVEVVDMLASEFEVVLVNTGSNWAEGHAQLLERSSCNVFVLDQRASSVRSCQHALDLCLRLGIATGSFAYALNRCERGSLFSAADISNAMHGAQVFELKEGGSEVEELLGAGLACDLVSSRNDFCASVARLLEEVLP